MRNFLIQLLIIYLTTVTSIWSQDSNVNNMSVENTIGRFVLSSTNNRLFRIDTSTGRVWEYIEKSIEEGVSREGWDELYESFVYSEKDSIAVYSRVIDGDVASSAVWDVNMGTSYPLSDGFTVDAVLDSIGIDTINNNDADSISVKLALPLEVILSRLRIKKNN